MIRTILLAGASALAFATVAEATTFNFTGSYQTFTASVSGVYQFDVWGAQGGDAGAYGGGLGAGVGDTAYLPAGAYLVVLVGGQGQSGRTSGGGGGSSGIFVPGLGVGIVAGGGGGASAFASPYAAGGNGQAPVIFGAGGYGHSPTTAYAEPGGSLGDGGAAGHGGGGGGDLGPGENGHGSHRGRGGFGFYGGDNGHGFGGADGGYGFSQGGGGGRFGGGGGGGISGGGGGVFAGGGGGGSYDFAGDNFYTGLPLAPEAGDGEVIIDLIPVPEPPAWGLMLGGFGLLGYILRRRILRTA